MSVNDVVSRVGLWWPAADEDGLRQAAAAWERTTVALNQAAEVGRAGVAQARAHWSGGAADRFEQAWREHEKALRDDAAGCVAVAGALLTYADAVSEAKRRVEEIAVTAGATIVAGVGLAVLTVGTSAAVAGEVTAGLVAMAASVGVELSSTVAAISAGALTGAVFGAGEAAVVDMTVTQPLRVEAFHDGGYSATEAVGTMTAGEVGGGTLGGFAGVGAVAPMMRTAAGDLSGVRAPGAAIRAALDPSNWGSRGLRFRPGIEKAPGVRFEPHELNTARFLAGGGESVYLRPKILKDGITNPDALVRRHPGDSGTYTELKEVRAAGYRSVVRSLRDAEKQLGQWGGGEVVVDGRRVGLSEEVAREGFDRAVGAARSGGKPIPERARIILGDGRTVRCARGEIIGVDR